jgi:endonuclease G
MKKHTLIALSLLLIISACSTDNPEEKITDDTPGVESNIEFGIPEDSDASNDFIVEREQYVLSYNPDLGVANWVSWNVDAESYGTAEKTSGYFRQDTLLPDSMRTITDDDYTNSGFDRGQLVFYQERSKTEVDLKSTYFITNALPQTPDLNRGPWAELEEYIEKICIENNKECYCIAGPIFTEESKTYIAEGKIAVPDAFFKLILVTERSLGLESITEDNSQIISVMIPNEDGIKDNSFLSYTVSPSLIESYTGYDFFAKLPNSVEEKLEKPVLIE